jgi:hypothetical protein
MNYQTRRKLAKIFGGDYWINALIISLIILIVILAYCSPVDAHEVHLSEIQNELCPMSAGPSWIEGIGFVFQTTCADSKKVWWLMYKSVDIQHTRGQGNVHAKPITQEQAIRLKEVSKDESD